LGKTVIRQDLRDYQDLFFLHHFPDENFTGHSGVGGACEGHEEWNFDELLKIFTAQE
jgi:hypothetical protein